ncbi:MAG: hypothetical protein ABIF04_05985 [Chloroflexota bacterium]
MFTQHKKFIINLALTIALLGSGLAIPAIKTQAADVTPRMRVTLKARNSTYAATVYIGIQYTFQASVENTGNVPLQVVANLDVPQGWNLNNKYNNCPSSLAAWSTCTFTWEFTPQVSGQVYLRVYVRGHYSDASGNANRITQSPAFIFNVKSLTQPGLSGGVTGSSSTSSGSTGTTTYVSPNMAVTLITNDLYTYSATVKAGNGLIFRARVNNTGKVPLQVVANLTVPQGWEVDQNSYSDCPDDSDSPNSLAVGDTCTISWYFTPQGSGQVYLRVYARGHYTTSGGSTDRITRSPAFIFKVVP